MTTAHVVGTGFVNGVEASHTELNIEQQVEVVRSRGPRPDPAWSTHDAAGHFHAYSVGDDRDRYPTLREDRVEVPCDGSCDGRCGGEGYTRTDRHCRICNELVEPGVIHGDYAETIGGRYEWTAAVALSSPVRLVGHGELVSFRFDGATTHFGVGRVVVSQTDPFGGLRLTLAGHSELGRRQAAIAEATTDGLPPERERLRATLRTIAEDAENDVYRFEGQPFTGKTVAEYMGCQAAAIKALAGIVEQLLPDPSAVKA